MEYDVALENLNNGCKIFRLGWHELVFVVKSGDIFNMMRGEDIAIANWQPKDHEVSAKDWGMK